MDLFKIKITVGYNVSVEVFSLQTDTEDLVLYGNSRPIYREFVYYLSTDYLVIS